MKYVRHKIILSMVIFSLLATVTAGGFSLAYIYGIFKQNTNDYLIATSKAYGNQLNTAIVSVESTVETLSRSVLGIVEKDRLNDPAYFSELSGKIEKIVAQFDRNTVSAMSVYVRFDPKISYATAGVFHADTNGDGLLETLNHMVVNNLVPKQKTCDYKIVLNGEPGIEVVTYPGAILQIVTQLINNSMVHGFADRYSGTIKIGIEKKGSNIKITYEDDGNGVAPENLDKIFTPFFSTRKIKGATGLGLHIVHNLVTQNLMGTLTFHSDYGVGVFIEIAFKELSI